MEVREWITLNRERGLLIDKAITGALTAEDRARLNELTKIADEHLDSPRFVRELPPELESLIERQVLRDVQHAAVAANPMTVAHPELDGIARGVVNDVARSINRGVSATLSKMPYKAQYVLEKVIELLQEKV